MLLVGLTGGIGSGKSTVAAMLAERGAVVVDADDLARRAVESGTPGFHQVEKAFGPSVLRPDGSLDREALAAVVFRDPESRRKLESIVHPEVARLFMEERGRHEGTDRVLVYVVPLLVENGLQGMFDVVLAVTADEATRLARLEARGMAPEAARERMAVQLPDADRERVADVVIRNDGSREDLERRVDEVWADLTRRAAPTG
ncbi:MAG: dephospho-CoA kinase [Actinomycetota bacterium]|nr:dephospho-CoA kinase [Actinomycetota bacterium]